ncbi:MAG: hypothetical protein Fur0037_19630 [Planctomycetota bacterium]
MNCRTCRFELSQLLDGRLASGRRTKVLDHVASCPSCAGFQDELQQAQRLALRLPCSRVSGSFREELFERIRSGEGTPEAVFREPIPAATKIRYALTGAAAAAAVLVAASLLRPSHSEGAAPVVVSEEKSREKGGPDANAGDRLAAARDDQSARTGGLRPRERDERPSTPASFAGFQSIAPATPGVVATQAAVQFETSLNVANRSVQRFVQNPELKVAHELCKNALELRQIGSLLLDLRNRNHLSFSDEDVDRELSDLVSSLDEHSILHEESDRAARRVVMPVLLRTANLRRLPESMLVRPALSPSTEVQWVSRLFAERREILSRMFEMVLPEPDLDALDFSVRPGTAFAIPDECGSFYLVIRRPHGR